MNELKNRKTAEKNRLETELKNAKEVAAKIKGKTVKLTAKDARQMVVGEGNGPVNALDAALRAALIPAFPAVAEFELTDYKVRILDDGHGTDATVRTLIDTSFGGETWTTVGVGTNVIEASWEALSDALAYGIMTHLDD